MDAVMVVEVLGSHNRIRARHRIVATGLPAQCTVGRSAVCDVVLDDPYVAAVHARITVADDGNVTVSDLDSVNGIKIGGRRLHGVEAVPVTDGVFGVGRTRLRVRTVRETLAPEQVDRGGTSWKPGATESTTLAAGFAVSVVVTVFEVWTKTAQPRELSAALVTMLLGFFALTGLWIALWALASRVAFGESRWKRHATIVFTVYAAVSLVALAVEVLNGALGLHLPSLVVTLLVGAAAAAALSGHLLTASPMRARIAVAIGVAIPTVALANTLWMQARSENRSPTHIADHDRIVPPALLLRRGLAFDAFAAELADLRARADAKRVFVEREDPSPQEDDSE